MKGKKILAGILSAAMVLGTMAVPAFADTLTTLPTAVNGVITIDSDAEIDLQGATVNDVISIEEGATSVTIKNGHIVPASENSAEYVLAVNAQADVKLDGVTLTGVSRTDDAPMGGIVVRKGNKITIVDSDVSAGDLTLTDANKTNATRMAPKNAVWVYGVVVGPVEITDSTINGGDLYYSGTALTSYDSNFFCNLEETIDYFSKGDLTLKNSIVNGGSNDLHGGGDALLMGQMSNGAKVTIDNSKLYGGDGGVKNTFSNHGDAGNGMYVSQNSGATKVVIQNDSLLEGGTPKSGIYSDAGGLYVTSIVSELTIKDSTITAAEDGTALYVRALQATSPLEITLENATIGADNGLGIDSGSAANVTTSGNVTFVGGIGTKSVSLGGNGTVAVQTTSSSPTTTVAATVTKSDAVFGDAISGYESLDAALAAAKDGDTITMYADATPTLKNQQDITKATTIDLNGKILTLNCHDLYFGAMTFKNGTIDVDIDSYGGTAIIWQFSGEDLTFDNVTINANSLSGCYLIGTNDGTGTVTMNDSTLNSQSDTNRELSAVFGLNGDWKLVIVDSKINVSNIDGHVILWGDVELKGDKTEINADGVGSGIYLDNDGSLTVSDEATINITNVKGGDDWNLTKDGIVLAAETNYAVADTATVNASIYRAADENNLANTVKVSFADVTAENAEGEKVYDIYVEADSDKTINRLTAVQMALNLSTTDDFEMTVTAADGVTRSFEKGMYLFNFDGETKPSATGTKIKLGQVKLVGYGKFTLAIDETEENKAHATTNEGENLVTDFIPNAGEGQGTFDISASLTDTVKKATRNLTINIDFNHAVENHAAAYQDMTVTVTGPDAYEKVIELGSDKTEIVDNKVTIEIKDELVLNTQYNVEVKGAGYRTVNHPVNMNADKTLNFWNNYKNTAVNVEENNDATAKNTTFLAGELVKDGKINIYDLSAVVSYFGTSNDVKAESDYAKYDLDRNGKIDSKDVAYVLVSWGK